MSLPLSFRSCLTLVLATTSVACVPFEVVDDDESMQSDTDADADDDDAGAEPDPESMPDAGGGEELNCPFSDIREGVDFWQEDPAHVQETYDTINRSMHIYGDVPMMEAFNAPVSDYLSLVDARLETLQQCTGGYDTDVIRELIYEIAEVSGDLTIGEIVTMPPGERPELEALLVSLDGHLAIPTPVETYEEAELRAGVLSIMNEVMGDMTFGDMFFKGKDEITDMQQEMVAQAMTVGVLNSASCSPNDRCCYQGPDADDVKCVSANGKSCYRAKTSACSGASDDC